MSLFASLGQGDIWALSGIVFPNSPLMDLLESDNFTLEDLLREDELIQEVKAKNGRLLDFLCREECIEQLVEYVVRPAQPDDCDDRKYKYPYMSCEVICCEIPEILHALTQDALLHRLFSFLDTSLHPAGDEEKAIVSRQSSGHFRDQSESSSSSAHTLDCYLAGYFEKILEMLFRNCTLQMMAYFNAMGVSLLERFLRNIANYSIMQIVQRLLLPHLPFTLPSESECVDEKEREKEREREQCHWSFLPETCSLLVPALLRASHEDAPLHVSDMLITVLQLSPADTLLVALLCEKETLSALLTHATDAEALDLSLSLSLAAPQPDWDELVNREGREKLAIRANIALAATSVLESLVSRLFEACFPSNPMLSHVNGGDGMGGEGKENGENSAKLLGELTENERLSMAAAQETVVRVCAEIVPFIGRLAACLRQVMAREHDTLSCFPSQRESARLGHHGLQLVKLVESLARVGSLPLDEACCEAGLFDVCVELMDKFEYHSVLHLSVQRIFVSVLESGVSRSDTQVTIVKSRLLSYLMDRLGAEDTLSVTTQTQPPTSTEEKEETESASEAAQTQTHTETRLTYFRNDESHRTFSARHSSLTGNLILIAHAAFLLLDSTEREETASSTETESKTASETQREGDLGLYIDTECDVERPAAAQNTNAAADKEAMERALFLRSRIDDEALLSQWDSFCFTKLKAILDHQMVGSYELPAPELSYQQSEEHFKAVLAAEMDPFQFEDDDHSPPEEGDFFSHTHTASHTHTHSHTRRHARSQGDSSSDEWDSDDSDDDDSDDNEEHENAVHAMDFNATLRGKIKDDFWAASSASETRGWYNLNGNKDAESEPASSTVVEEFADFADFSVFEGASPTSPPSASAPASASVSASQGGNVVDRMVSSLDQQLSDDFGSVNFDDEF